MHGWTFHQRHFLAKAYGVHGWLTITPRPRCVMPSGLCAGFILRPLCRLRLRRGCGLSCLSRSAAISRDHQQRARHSKLRLKGLGLPIIDHGSIYVR